MKTAKQIYDEAIKKSREDHERAVEDYIAGRIEFCSPSGIDRDRQYVIDAFQKALDSITT